MQNLLDIVARLRDPERGCPWDLDQDFSSVAPYTLEEAYEVADAIARADMPSLRDELGDLLFQVVLHARMAEEAGEFAFDDVLDGICDKMLRRHPHVFGSDEQRARGAVPGSWEEIKASERQVKQDAAGSVLDGIALPLPALTRARKLGKRASFAGFDWPDSKGVRDKIDEEFAELNAAVQASDQEQMSEELGDLLFAVVNLARHLKVDPEQALGAANRKFERRFRHMEREIADGGGSLADFEIDALEIKWQAAKKSTRS